MTKNSDLVKNDFKTISLKKEIPLKIKEIRNSIVAIQELATCSLMKLERISSKNLHDVDGLAVQIQSIANEVDHKTSTIEDILDDLSPSQLRALTETETYCRSEGFCGVHGEAYQELSPSEFFCESCFEEVNLHCPCCHRFNEDLRTGYCDYCIEEYKNGATNA
jgi:hypothetical protein